jgi:hypothetical protein
VGFGLLPQAGLALALSMLFTKTFPSFGAEAGALTLGIVALNEMVAPILYRFALVRSGEAGQSPTPSTSMENGTIPADVAATTAADLVAASALTSGPYPVVPPQDGNAG